MHVATSVIEDQPLRATPAEGETLYEFSQSLVRALFLL